MVQLLKSGKGKEVSYNALATHIIAEDGDNPEVSESREVFDLPVVKVSINICSTHSLQKTTCIQVGQTCKPDFYLLYYIKNSTICNIAIILFLFFYFSANIGRPLFCFQRLEYS